MNNRKLLQNRGPVGEWPPALDAQLWVLPYGSMPAGKFPMAAYDGLTDLGKIERAAGHLPPVLDNLHGKLKRVYDKKFAPPARGHFVAINWVETDELLLEINANICATRDATSATKVRRPSSCRLQPRLPSATLISASAETKPATASAWTPGYSHRSLTNQ